MQILKDLYFLPFKGKKAHLKKKAHFLPKHYSLLSIFKGIIILFQCPGVSREGKKHGKLYFSQASYETISHVCRTK